MMNWSVSLLVVICCALSVQGYDFIVDADTGSFDSTLSADESSSITWIADLTPRPSIWFLPPPPACSHTGVLKLDFDEDGARSKKSKVLIEMSFDSPQGISFNIGDAPDNNGFGLDSTNFAGDAEIAGDDTDMKIIANDGSTIVKAGAVMSPLRIVIADGLIIWNNVGQDYNVLLNRELLFALGDQTGQGSPNGDIYFAINRRISNRLPPFFPILSNGLCQLEITWLDWAEGPAS